MKHIGQTIQTVLKHLVGIEGAKVPVLKHVVGIEGVKVPVLKHLVGIEGVKVPVLKHLVGIEGVKVPSESSNRRMILESNLLANLQVGEKMLSHELNTLHVDGTTDAQKHFLEFHKW